MIINVGTVDRLLRAGLGLGLLYLGFLSGLPAFESGVLKIGAITLGLVMFFVSASRFCPIYAIFGIKTCRT